MVGLPGAVGSNNCMPSSDFRTLRTMRACPRARSAAAAPRYEKSAHLVRVRVRVRARVRARVGVRGHLARYEAGYGVARLAWDERGEAVLHRRERAAHLVRG